MGRDEDRRHHGHQAHRRTHPRPDGERLRDAEAVDRERRDDQQHRRAAREHRAHARLRFRSYRGRVRPRPRSLDAGLRRLPAGGQPRSLEDVRGGQLPRNDDQRPLSDAWDDAAGDPLELLRRGRLSRGDPPGERDPAEASRDLAGRQLPRGRRALRLRQRPELPVARAMGHQARPAPAGDARSGIHVLRAEGAADSRQEGLHDGAVPFGCHVPRLPPSRRLRG
jgi:hypothetical protein